PGAPEPMERPAAPPQEPEYLEVHDAAEVAALPATATHVRGFGLDAAAVAGLARLHDLTMLDLLDCPSITDAWLRNLAAIESLTGLRVIGRFAATPAAFPSLAELPRLQNLALLDEVAEDPGRTLWLDDACLQQIHAERLFALALTARIDGSFLRSVRTSRSLRHLLLHDCPSLDPAALRDVPPSVRDLNLEGTGLIDTVASCRHLRDCTVTCTNGLQLVLPADPAAAPTWRTNAVRLAKRTDPRTYGNSAYSFRYDSASFEAHQNVVDLVFNGCGNLHFACYGGNTSRLVELGEVAIASDVAVPEGPWLTDSVRPAIGRAYAERVRFMSQDTTVLFRVVALTETAIELEWRLLDDRQRWSAEVADVPRAAAGAMGQCGGPHAAR
ncbi:MAG: hypothetical protein KDE27_10755, partial [Planctomycetes bacterium]|nr:hypothetical protein [Planctomycetota bacterium]